MVNLITDGSLVGFWPLDEPSGTPIWKNHSPSYAKAPSGVPFDFTVAVADLQNVEEYMSIWPGPGQHINPESGTTYIGYQVQGSWRLNTDSSPLSRYLVLGAGNRQCAEQLWQPPVANSGFTVGFWVYPNSDGYENFQTSASLGTTSWYIESARCHTLIGAFQTATAQGGWRIGVSGIRSRGAQFNFSELASKQLRAFAYLERANTLTAPTDLLSIPIESGRYTHIAYTYRYTDGTINEVVLYKDGRVAASGTTNLDLVNNNAGLITTALGRTLAIGASDDGTAATDDYERTSGWNNLMSGVYFFKRVLNEAEILDMHQRGGLQPALGNLLPAVATTLTSNYLVAYYPFMEPGYGDISKNHRPCISNFDLGDQTERVLVPGPHGFGASFNNAVNTSDYHAVPSGACFEILNARSWTIGVWIDLQNVANRDDNIWLSWGSTTSATNAITQPASITLTLNTCGLVGTVSGIANAQHAVLEVYPRGDNKDPANIRVFNLLGLYEYYNQATAHIAVAYDDSTRGLAVYINGALAESGTLNHSLTDQLLRITGSGFPLMFGNGVQDQISDATTKGLFTTGGLGQWLGPAFLANKALVGPEIRGIALSGIDIAPVLRTRHDPRLVAYWPCTAFQMDDVMVLDEARAWSVVPGHLMRGDTFASDERWYDRLHDEGAGSVFRNDGTAFINQFGTRVTPSVLSSYGNLGITSGIFIANAGSLGAGGVDDALDARSSVVNLAMRYKPVIEERDASPQNIAGEFLVCFEVTPSGNVPAIDTARTTTTNEINVNCLLFTIGNSFVTPGANDSELDIFLTSLNSVNPDPLGASVGQGGSGITIRIDGQAEAFSAANYSPLVSGRISYGIPSRVLVHGKFDNPYEMNNISAGTADYTISLWINGTLIQRLTKQVTNTRIWSAGTPDSTDYAPLSIGGSMSSDILSTQAGWQGGLGDIYMREIFMMKGTFMKDEIAALAASGIQTPIIAGYVDQPSTTQVTTSDAALKAYWRFNGFAGGGSGTTDISGDNNHLFPAAQRYHDAGLGFNQAAGFMRFMPAMFANSSLGVQCSGVSYGGTAIGAAPNRLAPFMASGVVFDSPNNGFSIGFFMKKKDDISSARCDSIIAYGMVPTTHTTTAVDYNYGWTIVTDQTENTKIVASLANGNMYLDNAVNAAMSGQIACGVFGEGGRTLDDLRPFERQYLGDHAAARLDSWAHYCWTFDSTDKIMRCYLNGQLVDTVDTQGIALQVPLRSDARYMTFFQHSATPWVFNNIGVNDYASVLTDVFYFTRPLSEAEVRYIVLNGIDVLTGTVVSGVIGGYVQGQDSGSGIIGGYNRGFDTGSGIIGAITTGSIFASGTIAAYLHALDNCSGLFGGWMGGGVGTSGQIGGYLVATGLGSGICGGFMLGGLQSSIEFDAGYTIEFMSAKDFDAQLEIAKTTSADFDAKLIIFQDEALPLVDIIVPNITVSGLRPPFNQYFVGIASGQQGKTIDVTRWSFGDFTPNVSVAESGAGLYPVQHYFASSGFYIVKFEVIDSNGLHASATRIVNAASGINPVITSLSGVPRSGSAALIVDFTTTLDIVPNGVSIVARLLNFDDGQSTSSSNPSHTYTEPGVYKPVWMVRDSRGVIWCDSLEAGNDFLRNGGF